jgi:hypothetical protein
MNFCRVRSRSHCDGKCPFTLLRRPSRQTASCQARFERAKVKTDYGKPQATLRPRENSDREVWLGGLDSNQDNQIQSLMYCQLYDLPADNKKGRRRDPVIL